ncbi:MAG: class I SAM-dependent methyltransferase [Candidatus Pacebacteria bacterium]|nr:class I SAM-dependent methyltransferase [Candidatus Paceibacterota bacterium]
MKQESENSNDITVKTYQDHFDIYEKNTATVASDESKVWMDSFLSKLPPNAKILEIGSATGRDARYFRSKGFEVNCTDIIPQALSKLKEEGFKTEIYDFRNTPKPEWLDNFDGYFANGVFVHSTQEVFEENLKNISKIVHSGGIIGLSLKIGEGEEISYEKVNAPRYFKYYTEENLKHIISQYPFEVVNLIYTHGEKWIRFILKNNSSL